LLHVEVGFQPQHLATVSVDLSVRSYPKDEQLSQAGHRILERLSNLPGVESAGLTSQLPVSYNGNTVWIRVAGQPYNGEHNEVNERDVSAGFFHTIRARLLKGRYFTESDDASKPRVVIINQALARKYFPGEDPIGKKIGETRGWPDSQREVVGVVGDIRDGALDDQIWPAVYYPFAQSPDTDFNVVLRTSQDEGSLLAAVVAAIHEVDPSIATTSEMTMGAKITQSPSPYLHRSAAWLVGGFACVALLLGVVGLYGVIAYSVGRRTPDRCAHGVRRRAKSGASADYAGSRMVGRNRDRRGNFVRDRNRQLDSRSAVRSSIVGCQHAGIGSSAAGGVRIASQLPPRAPGGEGRAYGGAAVRIGEIGMFRVFSSKERKISGTMFPNHGWRAQLAYSAIEPAEFGSEAGSQRFYWGCPVYESSGWNSVIRHRL
jgi:hypothetical protein